MTKTLFIRFMDQPGRKVHTPLYCSEFHNLVSSSATNLLPHKITSYSGLFTQVPVEFEKKLHEISCRFDAIIANSTFYLTYRPYPPCFGGELVLMQQSKNSTISSSKREALSSCRSVHRARFERISSKRTGRYCQALTVEFNNDSYQIRAHMWLCILPCCRPVSRHTYEGHGGVTT